MNIINEINEREKCYKKNDTIRDEIHNKNLLYKTQISFEYLRQILEKKFPDLELVRIVTISSDYRLEYQDTYWFNKYTIEYAMIQKSNIELFQKKKLIFNDKKSFVIIAKNALCAKESYEKDALFAMCPIILLYTNSYYNEGGKPEINNNFLQEMTEATFPAIIPLYPEGVFNIAAKEKTRFLLYANSPVLSQKRLDNICMTILKSLNRVVDSEVNKKMLIYENIREKLLSGQKLNNEEWAIIQKFLNNEESKIRQEHTILTKSLIKVAN